MGAPGFWEDQERAAEGQRRARAREPAAGRVPGARARRRGPRAAGRAGRGGPEIARELDEQIEPCRHASTELEEAAAVLRSLRLGRRAGHGQRRRRRNRRPGLGRDGPADGDALGRAAGLRRRAAGGVARRGGGDQVGDLPRQGRERLRPVRQREGRPPAGAAVAVRLRPPAPDELRRRRGLARGGRRSRRSRSTTTICRSTRTGPAAPAASTSTRPTPPCGSPTSRPGSSSSARTSARSPRTRPRR